MTESTSKPLLGGETTVSLIAGTHPNGEIIIEKILAHPQPKNNSFQLLKSPMFVRGIARGDVIQPLENTQGAFKVLQHGGNLCVRVFSKNSFATPALEAIEQGLSSEFEKLGGDVDIRDDKALVFSIHVSCGFNVVEKILQDTLGDRDDVVWYYGNVYDPETGEPLDWWQSLLAPE
ncbi:DUF4265 domain-containing protein [Oceanicoccus sp. KOV_DT_Chl]|uniref:DUF4265 domain-containing protein n=1 Tax=Oceanicoccus sp. KOV_DT_Chl TaxID=1904639 RepID=UPI000C7B5B34|nr:DUF4265 domain-containing protein [Oceanicoccus sp. KOV_DT_Chl]